VINMQIKKLPKDARVASTGFFFSRAWRTKNSKKVVDIR
jgi:hypothetical protein